VKDISPEDLASNLKLVAKRDEGHRSVVSVQSQPIGGEQAVVIAGPCAVESREQLLEIAQQVKAAGAHLLRGGAFKPLTFPYRNSRVFELRGGRLAIFAGRGGSNRPASRHRGHGCAAGRGRR